MSFGRVVRLQSWKANSEVAAYLDQNFLSEMSKADINERLVERVTPNRIRAMLAELS
jgi:hypothetical protein